MKRRYLNIFIMQPYCMETGERGIDIVASDSHYMVDFKPGTAYPGHIKYTGSIGKYNTPTPPYDLYEYAGQKWSEKTGQFFQRF